ncbi:hypothetical protein [Mangrovicoccus sp. HB161399]|uniref:hypothetical protein n=1 Tax=Mangrovicoccus sp. HB161399 TaxID=2720392 RepID=UPI00155705C9|nr:hypothetical protein [Mangrovicoccus sp. HB161399]
MPRLNGRIGTWDTSGGRPVRAAGSQLLNARNAPPGLRRAYDLAFAPDFAATGHVCLSYSDAAARNRVVRYTATLTAKGELHLAAATRQNVIAIDSATGRMTGSHFGGAVGFGRTGCST